MKSEFDEYVITWFRNYVKKRKHNEDALLELLNVLVHRLDGESVSDLIGEQTVYDYLIDYDDAEIIYDKLFFAHHDFDYVKIPETDEFVLKCLEKAVDALGVDGFDFTQEFIEDMSYHIVSYNNPIGFFQDLMRGGCQSGMIGMLIYNSDCANIYKKYCIDMEDYREDMEEELGEPIRQRNGNHIPHYVWMCWLCYEELAISIARHLFEDEF